MMSDSLEDVIVQWAFGKNVAKAGGATAAYRKSPTRRLVATSYPDGHAIEIHDSTTPSPWNDGCIQIMPGPSRGSYKIVHLHANGTKSVIAKGRFDD
jgi:hypothetical protein